ncbi:MAG: PQQ-like beta-propeller repeat protein [Phycisphaerales bacterium]|nr:PQQ-like beta-propeller repeat protein [Phycisphaerales bacterium]
MVVARTFAAKWMLAGAALAAAWPSFAGAQSQDWTNLAGNGKMNGLVNVIGPDAIGPSELLWDGGPPSFIAWSPVVEGRRVFVVRQTGFPPDPQVGDATIYALNLDTGAVLWSADLPYEPGDWTTWIAGVKNGRVFASRSGNGGGVDSPLYCLDAATGQVVWHTAGGTPTPRHEILSGPYAGAVFADDGDIIVPSVRWLERIDAQTGTVLWRTPRVEQVGNTTGAVINGNAVYTVDLILGTGNRVAVRKFDAATGAFLYRGPLLVGGLVHNGLYIGVDGRLYLPYSQNFNANADFLYSFTDTGTAIVQNWRTSSGGGGEFARWGVGPDGSIYSMSWTGTEDFAASGTLQRLNPATGEVIATYPTPITGDYMQVHMAVDARGVIYLSNGTAGGFNGGRLYSFNPDLTLRWETPIEGNLNQGSPVLATDGTLIIASTDTLMRAYRTPPAPSTCPADITGIGGPPSAPDGLLTGDDFNAFIAAFSAGDLLADITGIGGPPAMPDGLLTGDDFNAFISVFASGCP